jgi:pimeloyl-ACP methyl ester carboxylesterase
MESLPASLLLIIAALAALVVWVLFSRWAFFHDAGLEGFEVATEDGWTLKAWMLPAAQRRFSEPVILCPGLANNHRMFDVSRPASLARALAEAGFDCYLVELRAVSGKRPKGSRRDASVDDHVTYDVPALVKAALERSKAPRAFWVGHSLGGLVAIAAVQKPGLALAGLVAIGSPFFFRHGAVTRALLRAGSGITRAGPLRADWAMLLIAPLAGWFSVRVANGMLNQRNVSPRVQRRAMASVFSPMWRSVLAQLHDWESSDTFRSKQGVDWRAGMQGIEVPTLLVAGSVDLLADAAGMGQALALLGATDKSLLLFGKAHGHLEDYGHGDLLIGNSAAKEVFPPLVQWLTQRATSA